MKKVTLGRGLNALIPTEKEGYSYTLVNVGEIKPNAFQPRKDFDERAIEELASSIQENGILQPLIVRKTEGQYEIIAGERRWRAAQRAGLTRVPVIIKDVSDREALELALVENLQREDLNPIEEATAYEQLIEDFGLTHEEISKRIGKERSTITNQLRLLKLPDEIKQALIAGEITAGHARAILGIQSSAKAKEILEAIKRDKLSVRKTEKLVQKISIHKEKTARFDNSDFYIKYITDELKKALGTQVKIIDREGKGKIEIEYYSKMELERLIEILIGRHGVE
ncbi:MAG TPA: ParB/RepB/Spo0J family partition protein [Thermodesulfobacteriota bacterium]|nr:ParB/RepB/Spo0J family partition protein [Thermodesulfobacteriota bacterium]